MDRFQYKVTFIILVGAIALLGPIMSSEGMAATIWFSIPKSYYYVLVVWLLFIIISGVLIQKSKW